MLALSSLCPVTITMKNGLLAHDLYNYVCAGDSLRVRAQLLVCAFPFLPPTPSPSFPLPASELELSEGKMGNNQRQIAVLPLPATLKWKGKCCRGCHPALSELRLADGCGAKMMHADGPVSVPRCSTLPPTTRDGLSTAVQAGDGALREVAGKCGLLMYSLHRLR